MISKYFKSKSKWLAGEPQREVVEYSESYARTCIEFALYNGAYCVEVHKIETTTFKIWRREDV